MDIKKKIAQLIIARLDGKDINKRFNYHHSLVKKGIGGFIIFGGKLKEVNRAIKKLQDNAEIPLFIASDLEQGLGQHIEGGTLFPPAMAIAQAINPKNKKDISLLRKSISIIAQEAKTAGINVIFSPVLDVNINPKNPIICTRAFSDNPKKVAWFGNEFINGFQKHGIIACAKHFPGHGNTSKDSHRELPVVKANMKRLQNIELHPFSQSVKAGVKMIMVGHLKVPAIDSEFPSSLSGKTIEGLLRNRMKFKGLVITDAMNMHAIKFGEEKASLMALNAGADIILHPSNPENVIDYLSLRWEEIKPRVEGSWQRVLNTKEDLLKIQDSTPNQVRGKIQDIGKKSHWEIAKKLTQKSIRVKGKKSHLLTDFCHSRAGGNPELSLQKQGTRGIRFPFSRETLDSYFRRNDITGRSSKQIAILIIDDDNNRSGKPFVSALKKRCKKIKTFYVDNKTPLYPPLRRGELKGGGKFLIIAVFSKISAWKGRSGLSMNLKKILKKAIITSRYSLVIGFCCPYFLRELKADAVIEAYSDSKLAQEAVAEILSYP